MWNLHVGRAVAQIYDNPGIAHPSEGESEGMALAQRRLALDRLQAEAPYPVLDAGMTDVSRQDHLDPLAQDHVEPKLLPSAPAQPDGSGAPCSARATSRAASRRRTIAPAATPPPPPSCGQRRRAGRAPRRPTAERPGSPGTTGDRTRRDGPSEGATDK